MSKTIITGIDIGTHGTRVVVSEYTKGSDLPTVLGMASVETKGMRHGYVVNREAISDTVQRVIAEVEKNTGLKIKRVFLGIGGISLNSETALGSAIITKADKEVTQLDINKAVAVSEDSLTIPNKKIIHSFPFYYKIDGKEIFGRAEGMRGIKLEIRSLFVTCLEQHLEDLVDAVTSTGIEVIDVIAAPLAVGAVVLSEIQKNMGCVLVDIGAETVSISVFENGTIISLKVFSIGAMDITKDIALGFKIDIDTAEKIKRGGSNHDFPKRKLEEIIEARLSDIFELVDKHLKTINRSGVLPGGVVIAGGGSNLTSIDELARSALNLPSKIAMAEAPLSNKTKTRDPAWFVALGLTVIGREHVGRSNKNFNRGGRIVKNSLRATFRNIIDQILP